MTTSTIGIAFTLVWFVFAIPTAVFLLRAYGRSKMSGFMWLLGAVVIWPFLAQSARILLPMLAASRGYGINPILMMNLGLGVVSGILLLIAVVILDHELAQRIVAPGAGVVPGSPVLPAAPFAAAPPPPTDLR